MKSFNVMRLNSSPYHGEDFAQIEMSRLNQIPGITYKSFKPEPTSDRLILITNTHSKLSQLPPGLLEKTELIVHSNSGYDHFNQDKGLWWNIPVIVGHEIRAQAVVEYYLTCLTTGLSDLPQHLSWDKSRNWQRTLIKDESILIFGGGHIGQKIYTILTALGANVKIIDPFISGAIKNWNEINLKNYKVVLICCSLNSTSHHLLNDDFFEKAHSELLLVNGARGKILDEQALREFLQFNPKAFAFLDVFEEEPFSSSWINFPQVWKTSHIAGVYSALDEAIIHFEEKIIRDFLNMDLILFKDKYSKQLLQNKWVQGELI